MDRAKAILFYIWFSFVSISTPFWIGGIYLWITGHAKGFGYDLGDDTGFSIFGGFVLLTIWLARVVPTLYYACRRRKKMGKRYIFLPFIWFAGLFVLGAILLEAL